MVEVKSGAPLHLFLLHRQHIPILWASLMEEDGIICHIVSGSYYDWISLSSPSLPPLPPV